MDFEAWWWLVLPLFFGLGWLARSSDARRQIKETQELPKSYFKGLNHLLNEEPDQAIDALIDVARVDTGTIDLYFALGNLFTTRGEIERAIRVYQSLLDRPDLPDDSREAAMSKLGTAFLNGGLFDRAEATFKALLDDPKASTMRAHAQAQLLHIYQSQQEWQQAIGVARTMNRAVEQTIALSHFHCELAIEAMARQDYLMAEGELDAALELRPSSIRGFVLRGRWYSAQGRVSEGLAVWLGLAKSQPAAVPLLVSDVMSAYESLGTPQQGLHFLYEELMSTGSVDVLNTWLTAHAKHGQAPELLPQLSAVFAAHPSLNALDKLLSQRLSDDASSEAAREDALIQQLIKKQVQQLSKYRCAHCGFEAARYYWQCPACSRWESYPPKRLEELNKRERSRVQM
ncbi:lipopolysaccharide assembly protein B [Formosimonas limnophila]|uniref:Lipopolysaccharide assembly protein B n=1 Tax=Formosimonas limnophila TaxID=1384487 RepID=A0A8J3CHC2_9BURK|nr:lipopolysaccharide assembly protein LapB [Formosimonas limnophila]GHA73507.1 lipopolysaccharide assembly protein B [Formosimonas limnophila]